MKETFLDKKIRERLDEQSFRQLQLREYKVDFCSNDYLGIAKNKLQNPYPGDLGPDGSPYKYGSSGSRLLAGNYPLIEETEQLIAVFHHAESGLFFNSGYDANLGLLSCVPQRGDTVIYDSLSHASLRDGIRLSHAQSFSFAHNDIKDLEKKLKAATGDIFIVTESVFSMDGDMAPLEEIAGLSDLFGASLIVDEAHATGVIGDRGEGLVQYLGLEKKCFARMHSFGKAVGCHGAIILGSKKLKNYLVNFSRPFIYTTSLPEINIAAVKKAYGLLPGLTDERSHLRLLINHFQSSPLRFARPLSFTPIQAVLIPGNEAVKKIASILQNNSLDVRPILYPTVPKNGERLRIVLHAFNTVEEVNRLLIDLL
jgi:8-amino-7-oxononanoate synthase